ncbi:MAG: tetratricopeptide repeat protein [Thermodesulfobacteriota bacterium]
MAKITPISLERKKELAQPDEFISLSSRMIQHVVENKEKVAGGVAAFLFLCLVVIGYQYVSKRSELNASNLLGRETIRYKDALASKSPVEALQTVKAQFDALIDKHDGTVAGNIAHIRMGDMLFEAGDYDQAIQHYQVALTSFGKDPELKDMVLSSLGYAHEAKGDWSKAVEYFQTVSENKEGSMQDEALFHLGVLYAEMGEKEKSRKAYQEIIDNHPDSLYLPIAKAFSLS